MYVTKFYLGTHQPHWLWSDLTSHRLFVSRTTLSRYAKLKPCTTSSWALDSGGFTDINKYGRCTVSEADYCFFVAHAKLTVGRLDFAAPQDWMCEPAALKSSGLTVEQHQRRTVLNFINLRRRIRNTFIPVLQGDSLASYFDCMQMYEDLGVRLRDEPTVGLGSVCRRQATDEIRTLVEAIAAESLTLHGFGVKATGLSKCENLFASTDSLAWSFCGRRAAPLPGHTHKNCANCYEFADLWRRKLMNVNEGLVI